MRTQDPRLHQLSQAKNLDEILLVDHLQLRNDCIVCVPCAENTVGINPMCAAGSYKVLAREVKPYLGLTTNEKKEARKNNVKFYHMKFDIKKHIEKGRCVLQKQNTDPVLEARKIGRQQSIGLNLGRMIFNIIRNGHSYQSYEQSILCAKLCGVDVGNINHSRKFVPKFLTALTNTTKKLFVTFLSNPLPKTGMRPPISICADEATFQGYTRHMISVITTVPNTCKAGEYIFVTT